MKNNNSHMLLFILCGLFGSLPLYAVTPASASLTLVSTVVISKDKDL
ncbi:hypothetical protein B0O79_3971 [Flavobacteriaceae bacterium MAR_2009_75]|nr:hypothetical protein B0O79_3971 [Flavobacteriaceae bacterium MAR_2009_75]